MGFERPSQVVFGRGAVQAPTDTPANFRAKTRRMHQARLAAELLPELPAPGQSIHAIMGGNYDLAQVICATLKRHTVNHLRIATLCVNKRTMAEVIEQLTQGNVNRLTVLVSGFFERHNKELYKAIQEEIRDDHPGSRIASARSHCKIVCFEFCDGSEPMVFEGSANLRKNGDREQLTAIRDRVLHDWHANWIDELVTTHEQ